MGLLEGLVTLAAAAKLLQSCPTLCDPIDGSPPGSSIPGILQARTLEWVAISFSNAWKWKVKMKLLSHVQLLATPWTAAYQAPPSMGFSRQEYWSGVPFAFSLHSGTLSKSLASLHPLSPLLSQDCCSLLGLFFSALSLKTKMPSRRKPRWVWAHLASLLSPFVALHWLLSNRVVYGG